MSKIGRRPIPITTAKVEIDGNVVKISGPKATLEHVLPDGLLATQQGTSIELTVKKSTRQQRMMWGTHRALLANKLQGAERGFDRVLKIVGLGFKAQLVGKKLVCSLGYSHKVEYELPAGVDVEVDKTGQMLTFRSVDKFLLGNVCDAVRSLRVPEPYKGTGIMYADEVIHRKEGKTK